MSDHFGAIQISADKKKKTKKPSEKKRPTAKRPSNKKRRTRRSLSQGIKTLLYIILTLAILFGGYLVSGFFIVPMLISSQLPNYIQEKTHLTTNLNKVTFNPFNFKLQLEGVQFDQPPNSNEQGPLLKLNSLKMDLDLSSLLRNSFACDSLDIDEGFLNISRTKDNKYNFSSIFNGNKKLNPSAMIEFAELPFLFSLNNITIKNSKVVFNDDLTGKTHTAADVNLQLPTLSNYNYITDRYTRPHFSATINGSPVVLSSATPNLTSQKTGNIKTSLTFDLHQLDLPLYSHYLPSPLPITINQGKAEGQLQVSFDETNNKGLIIGFHAKLEDFRIESKDKALTLITPETFLKGQFQPLTLNMTLEKINLTKPLLKIHDNYTAKTISTLLPKKDADTSVTTAPHQNSILTINQLTSDGGQIQIASNKKRPSKTIDSFTVILQNFSTAKNLATDDSKKRSSFKVNGALKAPKTTFSWQGEHQSNGSFQGALRVNNISVNDLLPSQKQPLNIQSQGKGSLLGQLTVTYDKNAKQPFVYKLSEGSLTLSDLIIISEKNKWLVAKNTKLAPLTYNGEAVNLGKIKVQDATLNISSMKSLSTLVALLPQEKSSFHEIEYKGRINILNKNNGNALSFPKASFTLASQRSKSTTDNFSAIAETETQGKLSAKGSLALATAKTLLEVDFSNLDAKNLFQLFTNRSTTQAQGKYSGKGTVTWPNFNFSGDLKILEGNLPATSSNHIPSWEIADIHSLIFSFSPFVIKAKKASFSNFRIQKNKNNLLSWAQGNCQDFSFNSKPFTLGCKALDVEKPMLSFDASPKSLHPIVQLQKFLTSSKDIPSKRTNDENSQRPVWLFPYITITNGKVVYTDNRLSPPWKINILQLDGKITDLNSSKESKRCAFDFNGTIGSSPLTLKGSSLFFSQPANTTYIFETRSFPLASFGEQIPRLLDIQRNGKIDVRYQSEWNDDNEKGMANFIFTSVHPVSSNAESALTLALLNDKSSVFNLEIPILHKPGKPFKPLFTHTVNHFTKLMVKTSIEPLLLAEKAFSFPIKSKHVEFQPGTAHLIDGEKDKLRAYSDLLKNHPRLQLILTGVADQTDDKEALLQKYRLREKKRIDELNDSRRKKRTAQNNVTPQKPGAEKQSLLKNPPTRPTFVPLLPKNVTVSSNNLLELAHSREETVKEFLMHSLGISSSRISLNETIIHAEDSSVQGNRVQLNIGTIPGPVHRPLGPKPIATDTNN